SDEIADIFIYLTYLCYEFKIDLFDTTLKKIEKNAIKYPIEKSKGSNKKYNEL
ncbi:MAG: nucleotide pyrophosphohydrolase, partial [Deltaproteobacteria bacterium]|nr:nucleotide pyrophosphohydrolase [Deltaproteobacteria bacterium]